jgi:hypothetical protein
MTPTPPPLGILRGKDLLWMGGPSVERLRNDVPDQRCESREHEEGTLFAAASLSVSAKKDRPGAIKERAVRMYGIAAAIGVACVEGLAIGGHYLASVVPEWAAQLVWLVVVVGASGFCGYRSPDGAWRWGAIIVGIQPPCLFLLLLAGGELAKPASSTGGMVAVAIFTTFMVFICPLAALASQLGARRESTPTSSSRRITVSRRGQDRLARGGISDRNVEHRRLGRDQCGRKVFPVSSSVFMRERIRGQPSAFCKYAGSSSRQSSFVTTTFTASVS